MTVESSRPGSGVAGRIHRQASQPEPDGTPARRLEAELPGDLGQKKGAAVDGHNPAVLDAD